jgi:hypothetical protein
MYQGVGVPDCVASGEDAARAVLAALAVLGVGARLPPGAASGAGDAPDGAGLVEAVPPAGTEVAR